MTAARGGHADHRAVGSRVIVRSAHSRLSLNLTAMIDVVFLLLVFFLVATSFKVGEEVFRLDLPERGEAAAPDPFVLDEEPLRIAVDSVGPGMRGVRLQLGSPFPAMRSPEDLFRFLDDRRIRPGRAAGLFAADHPIVIEPTQTARWEHVIEIFNVAVRAEYTNVSFAPSPSPSPSQAGAG